MDEELKILLKENLELSKENNKLLKKQWRVVKWSRFVKLTYWVVILALTFGAYYYIQPYMDALKGSYSGLDAGLENIQKLGETLPGFIQ